jgi:hypothetical protein
MDPILLANMCEWYVPQHEPLASVAVLPNRDDAIDIAFLDVADLPLQVPAECLFFHPYLQSCYFCYFHWVLCKYKLVNCMDFPLT